MPRRAPETAADYLAVAVCPVLIMLLVGSLMWFLVKVFLNGEFTVLWVMSFFVLGIVGVARMAMEEGYSRASLFGAALAGALGLVLPPQSWPILALVWWAAFKLTWDCTLIDDTQDASGEGLLQHMGLDSSAPPSGNAPPGTTLPAGDLEATTSTETPREKKSWWDMLLEPDRRPHAPGVWVVYFSLAALPLFGIGGWFVSDPSSRAFTFRLLVIYVASGMGLLLATSFLGLRRYLRQRRLQMPLEMTTTWVVVGLLMIVSMLVLATILPRPSREHSISHVPFAVNNLFRRASQFAVRDKGIRDDDAKNPAQADAQKDQSTNRQDGSRTNKHESQASGSSDKNSKNADSGDSGKSKSSAGGEKGKSGQPKSSKSGGDKSKGRDAEADSNQKSRADSQSEDSQPNDQQDSSRSRREENQQQNQQANQKPPPSPPNQPPPQDSPSRSPSSRPSFNPLSALTSLLSSGIKVLFYIALAVGLVIAAWMYRDELLAAWQKLMDELRELWQSWFGKKQTVAEIAAAMDVVAPPRAFASFSDPFLTGNARSMSWPQLVRYTFEALEAWGREHACPRASGQTALEFALALSISEPQIAANVQALAGWYSQLAYAPRAVPGSPDRLRELWSALDATHRRTAAA
jgi:hypothetical protein